MFICYNIIMEELGNYGRSYEGVLKEKEASDGKIC
jgi:hypothetical protein